MKNIGTGLGSGLGVVIGIVLYVIVTLGVPIALIGGGIWFYNDVINKEEPTQTYSTPIRDDTQVKPQVKAPSVSDTRGYEYEVVFVDSCATEAGRSACQCMYDYLDSHLTNDEFDGLLGMVDIMDHPVAGQAVLECYDK